MKSSIEILNAPPGIAPASADARAFDLTFRRLCTPEDYGQAIVLQRLTWGESFAEVVPAVILKITQRVGGVCAGAFDAAGVLQGFVYGITGVDDGRLTHWSHMMAVRPELRDQGLGRQLKAYQRELLLELGVESICWTFDPLVARNAHLNLNRLGAQVREFVLDFYEGAGFVQVSYGTDRLIVAWPVQESVSVTQATEVAYADTPLASAESLGAPVVRIEVPLDIGQLSLNEARQWSARTRTAFVAFMGGAYRVSGFYRSSEQRCYYVLTQ